MLQCQRHDGMDPKSIQFKEVPSDTTQQPKRGCGRQRKTTNQNMTSNYNVRQEPLGMGDKPKHDRGRLKIPPNFSTKET